MASRSIPAKQLRSEASALERAILRAGLATSDEIDPWKPGQEQNPDTGAQGWLRFSYRLQRLHSRGDASINASASTDAARGRADAVIMAALNNEPVAVELVSGKQVLVYPKSMHALMLVHALDAQLQWMTSMSERAQATATAEAVNLLPNIADAIAYTYQLLVWIVTHKGPDAPFAVEDDAPEIPEWVRTLDPLDVFAVVRAFQQQVVRLQAVRALCDKTRTGEEDGGTRPSWSIFFASLALDLHETPTTLIKHRSLIELIASVRLSNEAKAPTKEPTHAKD